LTPHERNSDVIVIGNGCAGLLCATILAESGLSVAVLSRGTPATEMSSGCVTGLGDIGPILNFQVDRHKVGSAGVEAEKRFLSMILKGGLRYARPDSHLIDAHGLAHKADLAPIRTLQSSDLDRAERISIVGETVDLDLLGSYLSKSYPEKKVTRPAFPRSSGQRSTFEDLEAAIREADGDLVIIPPTLLLSSIEERMSMMEIGIGRKVRETYAPLGLPGARMRQALQRSAAGSGVDMLDGMDVARIEVEGPRVSRVQVRSGMRDIAWTVKALMHCGGGVISGGLDVSGTDAVDPLSFFDIAVDQVPPGLPRIMGQGLRVDEKMHLFRNGSRLENAFAAGSVLPGISYPLGAGMGTAMTSAVLAAKEALDGW
jgi:anaerobic glycerol-3-phosphate dehydrogenase